MKYLIPALLASALMLPAAAFADEAMMQDHAAIHHTHHAIHHAKRAEHRALRHGNLSRAAHEQAKVEAVHQEHRDLQ